jgi:hypothetical protein
MTPPDGARMFHRTPISARINRCLIWTQWPLFAHTGRLESEPDVTLAALNVQSSACYEALSQILGE